jgi:RNA processing factor Prp31
MAALLEKDRNRIYTEFKKILGEEATQAMLTQLSTDADELVTKEHLDRRLAELRHELSESLTNRMLTVAAIQTAVLGSLFAIFR